jgi:hypothetical protein
MEQANFQVDARLATLLGQGYSSTEKALKELVDNAWDADAEEVIIALPEPLSDQPIVVSDNGNGMTVIELKSQYMKIASDCRLRRGERTLGKQRVIKGRKGIGKFAGLMAASVMTLSTRARGQSASFTLSVDNLQQAADIEHLPIDIAVSICGEGDHGTSIHLTHLRQDLSYPNPVQLRQELIKEYGRQSGFTVIINEKPLGIDDLEGTYKEESETLSCAGDVALKFSISNKRTGLREPGITLLVDGKAIGKPGFFGLDGCDDVPPKLLRKLYGEISANGLRDYITAGWDAVIENSESYQRIVEYVQQTVKEALHQTHAQEMQLAHARLKKALNLSMSKLPEHKRQFAEEAIKKVLDKYYDEPEHKVEAIAFVVLQAIERSDYAAVIQHLAEAKKADVAAVAEALEQFGLADMAILVEQAKARMAFLDWLENLVENKACLEVTVHRAIEKALWIFGSEYTAFSSNEGLKKQVEDYLGLKYQGKSSADRPDLLLNENLNGEYLLIEFKRPSHGLNHEDYQQATRYRHEFAKYTAKPITVLLLGGRRSTDFPVQYIEPNVKLLLFSDIIATARRQVKWQLERI